MKSHASINRIYRLVWNSALQLWVAVAENAKGCSKGGSVRSSVVFGTLEGRAGESGHAATGFRLHARCRAAMTMLLVLSTANLQVHAADALNATVVAGSGNVATTGNTTTINQATQNLAIDWTSLSTRANEALVFNQPNTSAIALNRIIGSSPSELLGSLTANGQVFILNPNGVLFGAGSQVNVGGLVASTLSLSNADFMAGKYSFSGGGTGSVVNQGALNAAPGGYLALLASEVRNEGVMTASLGTALLAAGNKVTLNLDNGSLLGYSIDQGAINALAENKQLIQASGGQVLLGAKALDSLTSATVNNTGVIEAKTIQNKAGRILLIGDMESGTVDVGGTLDASAPTGGNGGFIETSAAHVKVANDAHITTRAASGKTGEWLIDPFDFVVAAAGGNITGAALGAQLDNNNVTLNTTAGNSGTNGDLSVNDGVSWSGANSLTLVGERDVNVNANIAYSGSGTSGVTVQAVRDINIAAGVGIRATGTGALPVVLGGATPGTAAGGNINMGSGSAIASNGGDVTLMANAISLSGASVAAAGGNIAMTASGANAGHALEIANAGGTPSDVSTTTGNITLKGNLTSGGASATGGSAAGVVITNSRVAAVTGSITINGDAGWPSGVVTQVSRGVRLDSLAKVSTAGNISITGRVGGNSPNDSKGVDLGNGSEVSSTGGDVTVNGTFNNPAAFDGQGVRIAGKVAAPAGRVSITGNATVGGASGTGVLIDTGANISALLGVTITGSTSSSTTATNIIGTSIQGGSVASAGNIAISGTLSASSASGNTALYLAGGTVSATGAGTINLTGSGVPPPAPASRYDVNIAGTSVSSAGGQINLAGDRVNIGSTINAGAGRVVITPTNTNRQITLAGTDEGSALNLSNSELNNITAGTLVIGGSSYTGGIVIGNTGGNINLASTPTLSLINNSATSNGIVQTSGLTVANLKIDARTANLSNAANQISQISARTYGGINFVVRSGSALSVGTVDGTAGITNSGGTVVLTSSGALTQTQAIVADTLQATSAGGMTLANAGNQINNFGGLTNGTSGAITLRNTAANATFLGTVTTPAAGRFDFANTGAITLDAASSFNSSNASSGGTAATAAVSLVATGGITAVAGSQITNSAGGSVYLEAGNGSIGASTAAPVNISTAGSVSAVANGGASQVNLALAGGASVENVSAPGAVNVTAATGNLAVKTVSGSAVTLSAAAGAITDANGAANNITGNTLNATAANGITLGTNVTGLQTLTTTGAAGDISIAAGNALSTSNLSVSTNAGAAQTVSLTSAAGITVDSALGNAQDNFKLIATGGNLNVNAALQANQLTLSTTGTSAQTAAITATGLELLGTGSHTLNNAGNAVTTLAGNTGNVDYAQAGALTVGTVNTAGLSASGKVLVRTTGAASDITLNNGITTGSAANDSLVLAAGRNFVNNAGANPLNPGAGRFLVYATNPAANTLGAMASTGNAFGRTYAANAPADASMAALTGNRFVYSVVPILNVSGDNQTKAYGGADPALTYTVNSGLVAGDTAATALAGALSAPTGAATTNPTYAITQGTLASALGYNVAYTNGTLTVTGTPAPPPPAPAPAQSTASSSGVPAALNDAYVTALNNIAGTDEPLGGSSSSKSPVFDGASLIKALNDAAAEAEKESGGE